MNILVCEDDFCLDVFCIAKSAGWNADAFLAPNQIKDLPVQNLGEVKNYIPQNCDEFCIAIKDINRRIEVAEILKQRGAKFAKIIHPTCEISEFAEIEDGAIIAPFCLISADAKVGKFAIIDSHSLVGHNAKVGDFTNIGSHCDLTGFCEVDSRCELGNSCALIPNIKISSSTKLRENSTIIRSIKEAKSH